TEGWVVVISSKQVVWIVNETSRMSGNFGQFRRPNTIVSIFSLMHSEIWRPHSIMNNSLSVIPFLEVITFVFLMSWMNLRSEYHLSYEFSLLETFINKQII